jgi:integrase
MQWAYWHRTGDEWEVFLARARPLEGLGDCVVASCYLAACYKQSGLCDIHYAAWRAQGHPAGRRFESFLARTPQPANRRVLSLRGLPELVRLELRYAIGCRVREQIRTRTTEMRPYVDRLLASRVASVSELEFRQMELADQGERGRFARFALDRVCLAYGDPEIERDKDLWDLRLFGRSGRLDFSGIGQEWLRQAIKVWAAAAMVRVRSKAMLQHRVQSVAALSRVLATGPGGGNDPTCLGRGDVDRFLLRVGSLCSGETGGPYSPRRANQIVEDCAFVLREAREMGLLSELASTFIFRRGDYGRRVVEEEGRALPPHIVVQLDAHLALLCEVAGAGYPTHPSLGVLGSHAGEMAVLAYKLLKGTGRRAGEVASLHLECLDVDEHAKNVLVYDNHKRQRMERRLPMADSALVEAIRAQQHWVRGKFPDTPTEQLWLLPRSTKNTDGTAHIGANQIFRWMQAWVVAIPHIDAGPLDYRGDPVPFDRSAIHPHAWRHTYAQTLADQGVAPSVLRDLMDHRSLSTTLGYYTIGEAKKRQAMEILGRHTVDNRESSTPVQGRPSRVGELREELSWITVPMGKCSEPTNVRAGGQACPIRYRCAACPHFESDPSFLPELRAYADELRREHEAVLAAGAADWLGEGVARQLEIITSHIRHHEEALDRLPTEQRALVEDASVAVRKARQSVPVVFGRRQREDGRG